MDHTVRISFSDKELNDACYDALETIKNAMDDRLERLKRIETAATTLVAKLATDDDGEWLTTHEALDELHDAVRS